MKGHNSGTYTVQNFPSTELPHTRKLLLVKLLAKAVPSDDNRARPLSNLKHLHPFLTNRKCFTHYKTPPLHHNCLKPCQVATCLRSGVNFLYSPLRNVNRSRPDMVLDNCGGVEVFFSVFTIVFKWASSSYYNCT